MNLGFLTHSWKGNAIWWIKSRAMYYFSHKLEPLKLSTNNMVDLPVTTKILFLFRWFASPGILLIGLASLVARKTSLIYNCHPLGTSENLLSKRKGSLSPIGISDPCSHGAFGTPVANSCSQVSLPSQSSDPWELQLMTLQLRVKWCALYIFFASASAGGIIKF